MIPEANSLVRSLISVINVSQIELQLAIDINKGSNAFKLQDLLSDNRIVDFTQNFKYPKKTDYDDFEDINDFNLVH